MKIEEIELNFQQLIIALDRAGLNNNDRDQIHDLESCLADWAIDHGQNLITVAKAADQIGRWVGEDSYRSHEYLSEALKELEK
jgi:hypothetical protein